MSSLTLSCKTALFMLVVTLIRVMASSSHHIHIICKIKDAILLPEILETYKHIGDKIQHQQRTIPTKNVAGLEASLH